MGLSLHANYKGAPELSGGYGMLMTFRKVVALAFDKEFGEHYDSLRAFYSKEETKEWENKMNKILSHERFKDEDADIIDFLFMADCDGSISHKTAKKVYDLIKDLQPNSTLRYAYYSKNDWQDIKELLLGCYKNRAKFRWL